MGGSQHPDPSVLTKLREARELAEKTRWELLDLVILLHAVYEGLAVNVSADSDRSLLAGEPDHTDYVPGPAESPDW